MHKRRVAIPLTGFAILALRFWSARKPRPVVRGRKHPSARQLAVPRSGLPRRQTVTAAFKINHMMLPVANLDRSIAFYTRLLGMKVTERRASDVRKVDVGLIGYGDQAATPFLELTQGISDNAPTRVTPANVHIAIDVSDLRKLCAFLEGEGATFVRPLKQRSDGKGLTAWINDPDGNPIELAERYS